MSLSYNPSPQERDASPTEQSSWQEEGHYGGGGLPLVMWDWPMRRWYP